jgi:transposase-like protein
MPWKEPSVVEERVRFVLRLKDGKSMASLCREFGISRVTGYKIYERYSKSLLTALARCSLNRMNAHTVKTDGICTPTKSTN